jgi:hypothetical protein
MQTIKQIRASLENERANRIEEVDNLSDLDLERLPIDKLKQYLEAIRAKVEEQQQESMEVRHSIADLQMKKKHKQLELH